MTILKHDLHGDGWKLVYDTELRAVHVEAGPNGRLDINDALNLGGPGSDALSLAIVDLFPGPTADDRD